MNNQELIPVFAGEVAGVSIQLVDARLLHSFLEVGKEFANWIKDRIKQYNFQENQDFISFCQNRQKPQGGRPVIDYHITLGMAKELSMVERNHKGQQARRYFIDCERRLLEASSQTAPLAQLTTLQAKYIALLEQLNSDLKARPSQAPMPFGTPRKWGADEDHSLLSLKAQGWGLTRIGYQLGRSRDSVKHRYHRILASQGGAQ